MKLLQRAAGPLLFLGLWVLLLAGGRSSFLRDPGTFWHVKTGEKILDEGFIDADPFTFTFPGKPWTPYQWLGEVAMALVHKIGGLDSLLVCATALIAGLFAWLAMRMLRTGLHPVAVLAVLGLALAAAASHFHVRPHLITMVGIAATVAAVADVEAGRFSWRRLIWLVPAYWVWCNVHGGALGGLVTLALAVAGWIGLWLFKRPSPIRSWKDAALLIAIGLACGATAFATPYGADIVKTWLEIMFMPRLPEIVREHARTELSDPSAWPVFVLGAVYLFVLAGVHPRNWRASWFLPLFWFLQACFRVRHAPLFAVAALVGLADIWPHTRWAAWVAAQRPDFYNAAGLPVKWGRFGRWVPFAAVGFALLLQSFDLSVPLIGSGWAKLDPAYWPTEQIETLKQHEPADPAKARIFTDYIDGGFVIYHAPGYRVFVDDRCELFGDEWLVKFVRAGSGDPGPSIAAWEVEYGRFEFAMVRTGSPFDEHFKNRRDWSLINPGTTANFYERNAIVRVPMAKP